VPSIAGPNAVDLTIGIAAPSGATDYPGRKESFANLTRQTPLTKLRRSFQATALERQVIETAVVRANERE